MHQWKGLHEYYTMETPKFEIFSKKVRILTFDEELKSTQLRQYQSYISNWHINGKVFTSTTPWEPKNLIFYSKKFVIEFDLCWRAEINIQVGLNMHLYVDIGDASSSLWGSTSSFKLKMGQNIRYPKLLSSCTLINLSFLMDMICSSLTWTVI